MTCFYLASQLIYASFELKLHLAYIIAAEWRFLLQITLLSSLSSGDINTSQHQFQLEFERKQEARLPYIYFKTIYFLLPLEK